MISKSTPFNEAEESVVQNVIGAAIQVHRVLGPGYLESFYRRAMCAELRARRVPFETEVGVKVVYLREVLGTHRIDLVVSGLLVVELKAVERLEGVHRRQVVSYLKSTGLKVGLLINFNVELLKHGLQRVVLSPAASRGMAEASSS